MKDSSDREAVTTVLVHGVGMWPGLFRRVMASVSGPTLVWVRPGYRGGLPGPVGLVDQVRHLADVVDQRGPTRVIGVSGGATLALALAVDPPPGLLGVVTHEPLIGALEPELDQRVTAAATTLAEETDPATRRQAAIGFLAELYHRATWSNLPSPAVDWAEDHVATVAQEVVHFASFQPTREALAAVAVPHVTTVGDRSGPERHRVAEFLARSGAETATLTRCGHLAAADAPEDLARVVEALAATDSSAGSPR